MTMNQGVYLGPYIARKKLLIPQGPGKKPSSLRINARVVFSFDGDEMIDINGLLRAQSIMPYMGDLEALEDQE